MLDMRKAPHLPPNGRPRSRWAPAVAAALGSLYLGLVAACDDTVPAAASGAGATTGGTSASTGSESTTAGAGGTTTSSTSTGSAMDSGLQVDRGPKNLPIDGDPEGLWWDSGKGTLFIADNDNNRVLQWTDAGGFGKPIPLPPAPACGPGLGQVIETSDDTL